MYYSNNCGYRYVHNHAKLVYLLCRVNIQGAKILGENLNQCMKLAMGYRLT